MITINGWVFIENVWVLFGYIFTLVAIVHMIRLNLADKARQKILSDKIMNKRLAVRRIKIS